MDEKQLQALTNKRTKNLSGRSSLVNRLLGMI